MAPVLVPALDRLLQRREAKLVGVAVRLSHLDQPRGVSVEAEVGRGVTLVRPGCLGQAHGRGCQRADFPAAPCARDP